MEVNSFGAPDCYACKYRRNVPGDAHSSCINIQADVDGDLYGIQGGWFLWPINFDPNWLVNCNGFEQREK